MDEASQENTTLDPRTRIELVQRIFRLIEDNSLDEIKQIFETLQPEQRIKVLNYSIRGRIPIFVAIYHNRVEISRYLLKFQGRCEMFESWKNCRHPLIGTVLSGNPRLMVMILKCLRDIDEYICGAYSPLMISTSLGDLMSVKLIVAFGADINRICFQGRSPLMESTFSIDICSFLLSKGANVNQQDEEGFTALHLAVSRRHMESVTQLINAGADVRIRNKENVPPLIWATMHLNMPEVKYLVNQPAYTALDLIETLEILNACFVCAQELIIEQWMDSLLWRRNHNLPKKCQIPPREILDLSQEFTTERELESLLDNPLRLAFQGILVVERTFGRNTKLHLLLFLQTVLVAKKENNMEKVRQLIDYIEEYCQEISMTVLASNLPSFQSLFDEVGKETIPKDFFENGGFSIFKIIGRAAVKTWSLVKGNVQKSPSLISNHYSELVDTFLYILFTINTENFSQDYLGIFREVVTDVVGEDLRVRHYQSILHRAIKLMNVKSWSSVEVIRILLESGADANSKDCFRRTPIMYALKHVPQNIFNDILALLLEYGGHTDCRDNEGFTAMDDTHWGRCLSNPISPLSLQCLATGVIFDKGITYEGILPKRIKDFVNIHK